MRKRKHQPSPRGHERNIRCNNYWSILFRFFRNGSSGTTSTISSQSRKTRRRALAHGRHKRETKIRDQRKDLAHTFNKARSSNCRRDDRSNCYSAFWELWPPVSVEVLEFSKETNPPLWTSRLQIRSSPPSSPGDAVLMASRVKPSD